jgi:NTE family protein
VTDNERAPRGTIHQVTVLDPETALAPVTVQPDDLARPPKEGTALCLSGGGSRAMLFHAGALIRLNEAKLLHGLACVSSVSGGSIAAGALAVAWDGLEWKDGIATNLCDRVIRPLRKLALRRIDVPTWIIGTIFPGQTPATRFANELDKALYHGITLDQLPDAPLFIFNATNLASGVDWRFSKPEMGDYRVGKIADPRNVRVATAVAASSAFPPAFAPLWMEFLDGFRRRVPLADGGAYDNLGMEPVWKAYKTVLVSDGGGESKAESKPRLDPAFETIRVMKMIDRQVRYLRKRTLIAGYVSKLRTGTYWGIRTDIADYELLDALPAPHGATLLLAEEPTRLTRMPPERQRRLINWGYAVTDAAIRRHYRPGTPIGTFPYDGCVGPDPDGVPQPAVDPVGDGGG